MPDDIKLPEPYCYVYEYESRLGLHRSFYPAPWNGQKPTRVLSVYTADQLRAAVEAERAKRVPLTAARIAEIVREASRGSSIRRDGSTSERIASAVEAAHGITEPKGGSDA